MAQSKADATTDAENGDQFIEQPVRGTLDILAVANDHLSVRLNGGERIWDHEGTYPNRSIPDENAKRSVFEPADIDPRHPSYESADDRRLKVHFTAPATMPERPTYQIIECESWTTIDEGEVRALRSPNARGVGWTSRVITPESNARTTVGFEGPNGRTEHLSSAEEHTKSARLVHREPVERAGVNSTSGSLLPNVVDAFHRRAVA